MTQAARPSNLLLSSLARDDYAMLRPHLTQIRLEHGHILQAAERPIEHVYFPLEGMVSVVALFTDGQGIEIAGIGREGAVGAKIGLQSPLAFARAIVQLPGAALRIPIAEFQRAAQKSLAITHLASCATDVMTANLQQSAACNAVHEIESRLARWLLHASDRYEGNRLPLTQDFLGQMLGVRRTSVSLTAHALQEAGLIKYRRGNLEITNRAGLEARSCECYRTIRRNIELIMQRAKLAAASGGD